jgi:hypothetical protein
MKGAATIQGMTSSFGTNRLGGALNTMLLLRVVVSLLTGAALVAEVSKLSIQAMPNEYALKLLTYVHMLIKITDIRAHVDCMLQHVPQPYVALLFNHCVNTTTMLPSYALPAVTVFSESLLRNHFTQHVYVRTTGSSFCWCYILISQPHS